MRLTLGIFLFLGTYQLQLFAQIPYLHLSPKATVEQRIGMTNISVEYSSPHLRGRKGFGELVPYDSLWRTGANRNSKITFDKAIYWGEVKVRPGTYAIITRPGKKQWEIFLYKDLTHWEVPSPWDEEQIVASLTAQSAQLTRTHQRMRFSIEDFTDSAGSLVLTWENTEVIIPFKLSTEDEISEILAGPSPNDFYRAALLNYTYNKDLPQALDWIDKCIALREKGRYDDHNVKAKILAKAGRYEEALASAKQGLVLAKARPSNYGINESSKLIAKYEEALKE